MKTSPWRKPVEDIGGINHLIELGFKQSWWGVDLRRFSETPDTRYDFIVHSYREVGTALQAAIEVRFYFDWDSNKHYVRFYNVYL